MNTFEEQKAWFDSQWPALKAAFEKDGAPAVIAAILGHSDPLERRVLFSFCRQGMLNSDWPGRSMDDFISIAEAGMAELLAQAEAETDPELKLKRVDSANAMSYNLAADLADCWPDSGDTRLSNALRRERRHFERGLRAAENCLRWRRELNKPAFGFSIAYWVKGMHELSLGLLEDARSDFASGLDYSCQAALADGKSTELSAKAAFGVLLAHGYLAMAETLLGDPGGAAHYDAAIDCFRQQTGSDDKEVAEDAAFGIEQLETVSSRYVRRASAG